MPYIPKQDRLLYDMAIDNIYTKLQLKSATDAAGDFTYVVFRLLRRFSLQYWMRALGIGCLICAILETYRVDHAEYEDQKRKENGEI